MELDRGLVAPLSASIQTMNNASFLVFDDVFPSDDSDEDDLDRYIDVGLREQLFITLSRATPTAHNIQQKITQSAVPASIKTKRAPQKQGNRNKKRWYSDAQIWQDIPPPPKTPPPPPPIPNHNKRYKHSSSVPSPPTKALPPLSRSRHSVNPIILQSIDTDVYKHIAGIPMKIDPTTGRLLESTKSRIKNETKYNRMRPQTVYTAPSLENRHIINRHRPSAPIQVYTQPPMRTKLDTMKHSKLKSERITIVINDGDAQSDIPSIDAHLPDYLSASEFVLSKDRTHKDRTHSDRTHSLSPMATAAGSGGSITNPHCIRNQHFMHLHQRFSQQFANKVFDAHLKSYEGAFVPISPQHLGLMDFSNMRSRRRALFGADKSMHKPFINSIESCMEISNHKREQMIASHIKEKKRSYFENKKRNILRKIRKRRKSTDDTHAHTCIANGANETNITKDDLLLINGFDFDDAMYKTDFEINQIINSIHSHHLKRGDLVFIMEYQHMDCLQCTPYVHSVDISTAKHCMIVLQNIGSCVEIAHVTSHGAIRSFIREFAVGADHMNHMNNRGPPVAYRCVVYRLKSSYGLQREAANVAENLVKGGRVLCDPALSADNVRYLENPEKYFYRFLLNSELSLFRRMVRLKFDEGSNFLNFSSSEFVALCYQRALVNKRSFDRELIRLLDFCPRLTPPSLLQKYLHLNIDEYGDWECLGNLFLSYL